MTKISTGLEIAFTSEATKTKRLHKLYVLPWEQHLRWFLAKSMEQPTLCETRSVYHNFSINPQEQTSLISWLQSQS